MGTNISVTGVNNLITVASLFKQWQSDVKPHVYEMFGECQDSYCDSWMEFLDQPLAREQITVLQWSFAENYLQVTEYEDSWAEEFSRLLTLLGVEMVNTVCLDVDIMGLATYQYEVKRGDAVIQGQCNKYLAAGELTRDDVLEDLFLTFVDFEDCQNDFSYYCEKYALDDLEEDSKKRFDHDSKLFQDLPKFFTTGHTLELSDVISGLSAIAWKL